MAAEIGVEFDAPTQSLSALNAAAYRLVGTAACQIDKKGGHYVCRLTPTGQLDSDSLRSRFLELVTDENVRENLSTKTEPVRNLILSLAFGSLATSSSQETP
jgi:His-Xaa-Ser system protein HxsD